MTLSKETIKLIEKKAEHPSVTSSILFIEVAHQILTDSEILASVKGEEWVRKEDVAKVILWMCGYNDSEFPARKENDPPFFWRSILRDQFEKIGVESEKYLPILSKTK